MGSAAREMCDLFPTSAVLSSREQRALYDQLMGESNMQPPVDLRKQMLFAERLDRNGFAWDEQGNLYWTWLPMAWWRLVYMVASKLKQFLKKNFV